MDLVKRKIFKLLKEHDEEVVVKNPRRKIDRRTLTPTLNCKESHLVIMGNYLSDRIQSGEIESNPPCLCRIEGSVCMRTGYTCDDYEAIFCPLSVEL